MEFWETECRRSPVHLNAEQKHRQALSKDICSQQEHVPNEKSNNCLCSLDCQQTSTITNKRGESMTMTFDLQQKREQFVSSIHKKDSVIHNC